MRVRRRPEGPPGGAVTERGFFASLAFGVVIGLGLILAAALANACDASTGPVPSCSEDPTQDWCSPPVHDRAAVDGGR
jgi:hypothetical protein